MSLFVVAILLINISISVTVALLITLIAWFRVSSYWKRRVRNDESTTTHNCKTIAFFHPFCSGGGGGERVLWKMVEVLGSLIVLDKLKLKLVIYTIDPPRPNYKQDLLQDAMNRFSISIPTHVDIDYVHLHEYAHYLSPSSRFSMIVESVGTMRLAYRALLLQSAQGLGLPDVYVDTTGCAFTYVVARLLFGCRVLAYVHYPTISTDMLQLVWKQRRKTTATAFNHYPQGSNGNETNNSSNEKKKNKSVMILAYIKLLYYVAFAVLYGMVGSLAHTVMVNSSWTCNHIKYLWRGVRRKILIVFPPCSIHDGSTASTTTKTTTTSLGKRDPIILSIGQFRPEKDHVLQLEALRCYLEMEPNAKLNGVKLVMVGSCRNASDEDRLKQLQDLAVKWKISEHVQFVVNQPYTVVQMWLKQSSIGIHTMWNEHFGIGIVEMMAADLLVIAHNSGGPKSDIVVPWNGSRTGYLASTAEEYASAIKEIFSLKPQESEELRRNAHESASRFSDDVFSDTFKCAILKSGLLM